LTICLTDVIDTPTEEGHRLGGGRNSWPLLAIALLGTMPVNAEETVHDYTVHDYTVRVTRDLSRMEVEARFTQPVERITARSSQANDYLLSAQDCNTGQALATRGRRLALPPGGIDCMRYKVDLERAADAERNNQVLAAESRMVSPSRWLWRPAISAGTTLKVHFDLPAAVAVALPWRVLDSASQTYSLEDSPRSGNAPAVFGAFDTHLIDVNESQLQVIVPESAEGPALDANILLPWLEAAARDVSLTYGRFPNASPFVVVVPRSSRRRRGNSAVPFGRVLRDGGEAVELFVDPTQTLERFLGDSTATHEFSHMMHPYLNSDSRWISEGFAQYYQNVLLARSGVYDQATAWKKLLDGLERGRQSQPSMSPNEAARQGVRAARMKVYWSGAALALMADVTLRERSNGKESLDTVLDRLQACCLPSARSWSGREFLQKLDALLAIPSDTQVVEPIFIPLYERYANTAGFPDYRNDFEKLGIEISGSAVRLSNDAPLAAIRKQITGVNDDAAAWRRELLSY